MCLAAVLALAVVDVVCVIGRVVRALAAGITWTCRTASAPWGPREGHTSVIDAAGAIYVIGGIGFARVDGEYFRKDVWISTDKGAGRTLVVGRRC